MQVKVLVIGGGGREHALAWKLGQSPKVQTVFVAPGNAGTAAEPRLCNVDIADFAQLADFAVAEKVALTVVGPEVALAAGVVDIFRARGLRIFGPTREAAQLESSKSFAKDFMRRHGIPTAEHETFDDAAAAHAHVERHGSPIVVKADGLAAGKGVVVAMTLDEAHAAIDSMLGSTMVAGRSGTAAVKESTSKPEAPSASSPSGNAVAPGAGVAGGRRAGDDRLATAVAPVARVVVEAYLPGEEASFIVVSDGVRVLPLAASQDHKRLLDGDLGPNTGGMGAYSPAPVVTPNVHARVMHEIVWPTISGMAADGVPFSGFLYVGLMIDADGRPRTVEFNCRLGDPETQVILMRLKTDLFDVLMAATDDGTARESLDTLELQWDRRTALGVVMAASGYPAEPRTGDVVSGLPVEMPDCKVFHAATVSRDGETVTAGGRVLCVTALGDSVKLAQQRAYDVLRGIRFDGAQLRRDIGHLAIKR